MDADVTRYTSTRAAMDDGVRFADIVYVEDEDAYVDMRALANRHSDNVDAKTKAKRRRKNKMRRKSRRKNR